MQTLVTPQVSRQRDILYTLIHVYGGKAKKTWSMGYSVGFLDPTGMQSSTGAFLTTVVRGYESKCTQRNRVYKSLMPFYYNHIAEQNCSIPSPIKVKCQVVRKAYTWGIYTAPSLNLEVL